MEQADSFQTIPYSSLAFDEDGLWDSEQFEEILPLQFWRDGVPDQVHLEVLLKAWLCIDVSCRLILGDPDDFDSVTKHVLHEGWVWSVCFNGNMSVVRRHRRCCGSTCVVQTCRACTVIVVIGFESIRGAHFF